MQGLLSDAFEAAAERQRLAATRRREGLPTKFLEGIGKIPMGIIGAGAGLVDAAKDIAAEQTGTASSISTDYDPRRFGAQLNAETALNTMGAPMLGAGAVPGMTLNSGLRKPPPLVAVTHATGSPDDFKKLKLPPPEHDIGIHATVDPTISAEYADKGVAEGTRDFMSGKIFGAPGSAGPRTIPLLMDAQSALRYPGDAVKWNDPNKVIDLLESTMHYGGFAAPRGLLSDMYNISGTSKMWQDQFVPMLKDKGYDSIWYPHYTSDVLGDFRRPKYNTFMAFDPEQLTPRYSPEGQALIKERGVKEQIKARDFGEKVGVLKEGEAKWGLPKGILKPEKEIESFSRAPSKNTYKWWENPNSPLLKIEQAEQAKQANYKKQQEAALAANSKKINEPDMPMSKWTWEQEQLYDKFAKGKISEKEYFIEYNKLENKKDQHYGEMLTESQLMSPLGILANKWKSK